MVLWGEWGIQEYMQSKENKKINEEKYAGQKTQRENSI